MNRRQLLKSLGMGSAFMAFNKVSKSLPSLNDDKPIVLSTWYNQSLTANLAAWDVLKTGGSALDAVERGVMVSENDINNCCVGLGANPDRDGIVTLDACIMNHNSECGSVAFLEQIQHPIQVARRVMEKTPHVMLVGEGAQKFAIEQGFELKGNKLSDHARKNYEQWLIKSEYKPIMNIEKGKGPYPPLDFLPSGEFNHDTIGMIAMDVQGNLSGACTTSGMGFKMRGRLGDSPIIGAATATGQGEEVIRISGSFLVVEYMRQGYSPSQACKKAVERIKQKTPRNYGDIQVGFIALNSDGEFGGYALHGGFDYGVMSHELNNVKEEPDSLFKKK